MRFAYPYLWILVPLLLAGGWYLLRASGKIAQNKLSKFGPASRLPVILRSVDFKAKKRKFILLLAALALLLLSAARPLWGPKAGAADQTGADFFIVLDVSKSMLVRDVAPSRLAAIKASLSDWLKTRHGDRIGLILMAGDSFVQAPLTNDYTTLREVLAQSGPKAISIGGTNIPAAVKVIVDALEKSEVKNKAVVLISDGENLEGQALPAIEEAHTKNQIQFYTVGVGTEAGGVVPIKDLGPNYQGPIREPVRDEYGVPAHSRLDERSLRSIASSGGGHYYSFVPDQGKETWDTLYNQSLKPFARKTDTFNVHDYADLFQIPLILAIVLLILESGISTRLKNPARPASAVTLPEPSAAPSASVMKEIPSAPARHAVLLIGGLALFTLASPTTVRAANTAILTIEEAQIMVKDGKAGDAAEKLRAAAQKNPEDLYLLYNYGIASYAAGKFNEAIEAFSEVSLSHDEKLRSLASQQLGNAQYRLGEDLEKKRNLNGAILSYERSVEYYESAISERSNKIAANNLALTKDRLEKNLLLVGNNLFTEAEKRPDPVTKVPILTQALDVYEKAVKLDPANKDTAARLETVRKMLSDNLVALARDAREKAKAVDLTKDQGKEKENKAREKEQKNMQANQNYQKAREIDPNNAELAAEHDAFKKEVADAFTDVAAQQIDDASKLPENQLRKKQQALNQALAPLDKALAFDENNTRAQELKKTAQENLEQLHMQIADAAKAQGEQAQAQKKPEQAANHFTEAQQNYQKALALDPDNQKAKDALADVESKLASQLTEAGKNEMAKAGKPPEGNKAQNIEALQQDIGHLEKAAATFAQAEALNPGKNSAQDLQNQANEKLADLRSTLDKAQNESGQGQKKTAANGQPTDGQQPGEGEGQTPQEAGDVAGNSPTKPTLSFSEARAPSQAEGIYRDLRQDRKIRDW